MNCYRTGWGHSMHKLIALVATYVFLLSPAVADEYRTAESFFARGEYHEALKHTEALLKKDPDQAAYLYLEAMSAARAKLTDRAARSFERLLSLDRAQVSDTIRRKAYANYARSLLAANKSSETRRLLGSALSEYQSDPWLFNVSGRAYLSAGSYQLAVTDLSQSVSLDDRNWIVHNNLGLAYLKLGKNKEALQSFNRAIDLAPPVPFLYNNRGAVLENQGKLKAALADFEYALKVNPGYKKAKISAARVRKLLKAN